MEKTGPTLSDDQMTDETPLDTSVLLWPTSVAISLVGV